MTVVAIAATVFPLVMQSMRLLGWAGHVPLGESLFIVSIWAFLAAPVAILLGIGHALFVRFRMARDPEAPADAARPPFFLFCVCALLWGFVRYTFILVPLFYSEGRVQRELLDKWLDLLL